MKKRVGRRAPIVQAQRAGSPPRKYRSGVRPLEDRVTLTAGPGIDSDPAESDPVNSPISVGIVAATSVESTASAAAAYSTVSAAWFARVVEANAPNPGGTTEWIVRLTATALESIGSVAEAADRLKVESLGLTVSAGLGLPGQLLLRATGAAADVEAHLAGNTALAYWERNRDVALQATPNDPSYAGLYGLHNTGQTGGTIDADIDAPEAWNISTGSRSIVVAVIDTGIDYNHPDLAANIWTNPGEIAGNDVDDDQNGFVDDVHGYDFAKNDGDPLDDRYHGTHVAGVIGAVGNNGAGVTGVNWQTSIMALKFMNANGTGSVSAAVQAINYATMMRTTYGVNVRVTNSSWSGGIFRQPLQDAIDAGGAADILFVTAAGNDSANVDTKPQYPTSFDSPYIVSVAATDHNDQLATFSNYGLIHVDLAAPGVNVSSTGPGGAYLTQSGTSVSAPYVAGAAALALSVNPTLSALELKAALLNSVDVLPSLTGLMVSGGRLNVGRLLESLGMTVASVTPAAGSVVTVPPTNFVVRFGDAVDASSVAAADFQVNGIAADSFTITAADTVTFSFAASPVTSEGLQTMTMAAGAVNRAGDGGPLTAYTATFRFDALPLVVTASVPASSTIALLPLSTIDLTLNEAFDPASIGTDDLALTQGSVLSVAAVNATTVRYTVTGAAAEGVLGFTLAAGALRDAYGNGNVAYAGTVTLDYDVRALPPMELSGATHSLVYRTTVDGTIGFTGDEDRLTVAIDAGQRLTVLVDGAGGLVATIEVRDPSDAPVATATAATSGGIAILRNLSIGTAGTYTIVVRGGASTVGAYSLTATTLAAGATFHASTTTPADGGGEFVNRLDARLLLYDVGGSLVAWDDNSGVDGRNADLTFDPAVGGTYFLAVVAADPADAATSHGEYALEYSGAVAAAETFRVTAVDPPDGSLVTGKSLRQFQITFDDDVLLGTLNPSDFKIDGVSASQAIIVDGKTILFVLGGEVTAGTHTITLAAGSILNTHQTPLAAFTSTFTLDAASPKVVASSIQQGDVLSPGDLTYVVTFSEAMDTAAIDPTDFTLHGKLRNVDYAAASYSFDATGKILTIRYTALPEDAYTLVLVSGDGRFEDAAGNNLDGEPVFPTPPGASGNGAAGGDFAVGFSVDTDTRALEPALAGIGIPGAATYQTATGHEVAVSTAGDVDEITVSLDAGQTLTMLVTSSHELRAALEVYGPGDALLGSFAATSAGRVLIAQTVPVAAAGTYRVRVTGAGGTTGTASVFVTLNAFVEGERSGGGDNNSIAAAQSIDAGMIAAGGAAARAAVIGGVDVPTASTVTLAAAYSGSWTDDGAHQANNSNYVVGINSGTRRNFFVFDLSSIAWPIVGAQLQIENPTGGFVSSDGTETYSLFDVATAISTLTSTADGLVSVYDDLGSGTSLGAVTTSSASDGQILSMTLNAAALTLLNQGRGTQVAVGGAVTTLAGAAQQSLFGFTGSTNVRQLMLTLGPPSPDYYSFRLAAGDSASIGLKNLVGGGATVTLYDAAGNTLATSAAATGSFDRVISGFTATTTGTYYLGVTSATQSTYEIVVTKNAAFDNGVNETLAAAQSLNGASGLVSAATAVGYATAAGDYYAFTLASAGALQLSTATPGDGSGAFVNTLNPTIELYDSTGTLLAANADGGADGRNALLAYGAAAGDYVVRVVAAAGHGEYVLSVDRTPSTAPVVSAISDVAIAEDGSASVTFSVGDPDTPAVSLAVTASAADAGLLPASGVNLVNLGSGNWRLDLTPAADRFGVTTVTVRASDGTAIAGRSFQFTSKAVNDGPTFTAGANLTLNRLSGPQTLVGWASGISAGAFEAAQGLEFLVSNDNPSLFSVAPTISADGTLRFTPSGTVGKATITLRLHDAGGTSDGGVDTSAPRTFTITIDNNAPSSAGLDPTFDGDGILTINSLLGSKDRARDVARQAVGKLVVTVDWHPGGPAGGGGGAAVMRFNVDGTLDTSFGGGGSVFIGSTAKLYSVEVLSDGKILAGGTANNGSTLYAVRLQANGSFDTTYGVGGVAKLSTQVQSFPPEDSMGVAVQADGKLVFAQRGTISGQPNFHLVLARLTASGALDTTFGGGTGSTRLVLSGTTASQGRDVLVQSDGKILVVGNALINGGQDMYVARFLSNGTLDSSFGSAGGVTFVDSGGADVAIRIAQQADGKIVLGGLVNGTFGGNQFGNGDFGLVRLTADGLLDNSFHGDGRATLSLGADERIQALAVQADGRITVGGYLSDGLNDWALARYLSDGSLDTSFDGDGVRTMPVGSDNDRIYGMLVDDLQRIVVVGTATDAVNGGDVAVGRFLADGSLDTSFSGSGISLAGLGLGSARAQASAEQPDGKIVIAGWLNDDSSSGNQRILWRLMPDGQLDPTFGTGGIRLESRRNTNVSNVFIQKDGKILVTDALNNGLTRYNADGSPDSTFGTGGYVNLALHELSGTHAALLDDGSIVVVGSRIFSTQDMTVGRFTPDGKLDTTFDGDGKLTIDFNGRGENGRDIAVQADGKIVVVGVSTFGVDAGFAVARLNVDGSLDTTFATGGKGIYGLNGKGEGFTVLVQQDGKITVGGRVGTDVAMMRLLTDGTLDTSFGGDGFVVDPVTSGLDYMYDLLQQSDGKLVGVGYKTPGTVSKVFVGRYLLDGTPDVSFDGDDGVLLTEVGNLSTQGVNASLQADGRLIVTGFTNRDVNYDALILRYQMGVVAPAPNISTIGNLAARSGTAPPAIEFEVSHPTLAPAELTVTVISGDTSILPNEKLHLSYLGEGRWRIDVTPTRTAGTVLLTVVVSDGTVSTTETFNVTVVPPPKVVGVFASGSNWTETFLGGLASRGLGHESLPDLGYRLSSGAAQLKSLPWSNVDRLTIEFDRNVNVSQFDLTLLGSAGEAGVPEVTGFMWDADRFTATWTFASALPRNKYLVQLNSAVLDAEGAWLDGDWSDGATRSGDGFEGGRFLFRFNALPGDVDGSASVSFGEIGQMRLKLGLTAGSAGYDPRQDWDGSGSITFADVGQARLALGTSYVSLAEPDSPLSTGGFLSLGYTLSTPSTKPANESVAALEKADDAQLAVSDDDVWNIALSNICLTSSYLSDGAVSTVASTHVSATSVRGISDSYDSVSYVAASIGDEVVLRARDLRPHSLERSAQPARSPATIAPRFERLRSELRTEPTERETTFAALAGNPTGLQIGASCLNWRRLRRIAAPGPMSEFAAPPSDD